ncbi:MAG: hypothetical protein A3E98_00235 [Candidatus Doudnabacteria bacterium RIFCSPHIGHO2_12_FULL_48_11]|uniref:D-alanine--D-alanine ligase n=1 Tax=Candidatus Doudnabacteria bacterium RIFCSPHIGHO2_01_FULL_46_24 TaxID=1817825 RepID=A0A1F5NV10_9BACT|nr:MAG: hypothetical protein A2720_02590 [Candidatus Doudnabacteria bacterium RIFCSPHIGHO2_01_FULL_46_24]OGE94238.1 MAG: hypothetical protein A3E98_00235 [Candidatus Doudnabacteria bacterium RIFCSPHIGHO2_12_FULL_48_11]
MNIGVFFGSRSPEHDISIITGQLIISTLRKLGHKVTPVYLDKDGDWNVGEELGSLKFFQQFPLPKRSKFVLDLQSSNGKMVFASVGLLKKRYEIELAFPAFHGMNGEDGTIQGLFEIFNLPYVGCDVVSSAVTMDKILTKQLYEKLGIPTAKFLFYSTREWQKNKSAIMNEASKFRWPLFVKPAKLGSSIGIAKAKNPKELEEAIEVAAHYGERFLVEETVENLMDVTCAVLGNDDASPSLLQESVFESELFSYDEKYLKDGGAQLGNAQQNIIIPARLDDKTTSEIRNLAVEIFKKFGCSGIARVDFLYNKQTEQYFANEINTMPGTLYHHLWKASGMELEEVVTALLKLAQEKHQQRNSYISTFESSLLDSTKSIKLQIRDDKPNP